MQKNLILKQNKQLSHLYDGMHIDEMAGIDFDVIEFKEQKINSITESIVDSVLTHIAFENQNNSMYNQKKNDVKRIVEEEITSKKIKLTIEEINNIYESTLEKMQSEKNNFCMNYNEIQQQTINTQTISPNEQAFMNNDLNQLSTEGIFDDNYESENARRFKQKLRIKNLVFLLINIFSNEITLSYTTGCEYTDPSTGNSISLVMEENGSYTMTIKDSNGTKEYPNVEKMTTADFRNIYQDLSTYNPNKIF